MCVYVRVGTQLKVITGTGNSTIAEYYISSKTGMNSTASPSVNKIPSSLIISDTFRIRIDGTSCLLEYSTDNFATVSWASALGVAE